MTVESRSVVVRLSAETAAYIREMQAAGKLGSDAMEKVERSTLRADAAQQQLTKTAKLMGLGLAAALGYAAKAAVDWESQFAGVEKTVDGTVTQMAQLEGELRDLARTMPESHREIAAVAEAAGQLGVAREDVSGFTETMVQLGETTNLTADQAATDIAQIQNVMGTAADEVDNFGATLVALGNNGASTEAQILAMTQQIAGAGAQIGLTEADILSIANAAASMGLEVEAGGSAITRVFTSLAKATKQGGADLERFAEVAGLSTTEFRRAFEEDPARAFAAFTQGLDRINKSGGDVFTILDHLGMSDIRVSRALLSMAASGDYLTESLDLGAQAWQENSALAEEFAKRLDTDAAQVQIAINNIRDAAIELGATLLPVVEDIANGVSSVTRTVGQLPDPIQAVITKAAALALVVGGAGWFGARVLANVNAVKTSLVGLGVTADTTKAKLLTMGNAARVVAGLAAIGLAATELDDDLGVANTAMFALYGTMILPGWGTAAGALIGLMTDLSAVSRESAASIASWRAELEASIDTGDIDAAREVVARAREEIAAYEDELDSGFWSGVRDALSFMGPDEGSSYTNLGKQREALADLEDQLDSASSTMGESTAQVQANTSAVRANFDAIAQQRAAAAKTAQAFLGLGDSLNDSKVSLGEWIRQLEEQNEALRSFRRNAETAAKRGLDEGLIRALREAGPEGALRMRQLANASDKELARVNAAFRGSQREADRYVDAIGRVGEAVEDLPDKAEIKIIAQTDGARAQVLSFKAWLASQNLTKTVRIVTDRGPGPQPVEVSADGSTVPKTGLGYADRHLYLLADGEEIVSNRYGQADRWRPLLKAISANQLAGGGTTGLGQVAASPVTLDARATDRFTSSLERSRAALEKEAKSREKLINLRDQYASTVAGNFRTDPFGGSVWGAGDPLSVLRSDIAQGRQFRDLIKRLGRRGLNGAALAEVDTLTEAQVLSGMSRADLREYERLYNTRQRVTNQAGQAAGAAAYGRQIRQQTDELRAVRAAVDRLERAAKHAAKDMGDAVGDKINGAARGGRHDRSHPRV